jgi:hypothetical protein
MSHGVKVLYGAGCSLFTPQKGYDAAPSGWLETGDFLT